MIGDVLANWRGGAPRSLLLATDWSARCDRPLDRAIQLAHYWGAWLTVLTVVEDAPADADHEAIAQRLKARILSEMSPADVRFHIEVRFGIVGERLLELVDAQGTDLVVTGVAHHSALGGYVLGATVERMVQSSPSPLLVVKQRPRFGYEKILLASDYAPCVIDQIAALAAFPRARGTLVDVREPHLFDALGLGQRDREAAEAERSRLISGAPAAVGTRLTRRTLDGEVADTLGALVDDERFDLTILCRRGERPTFLLPDTEERLIDRLANDLLLLPPSPAR